MSFLKKLFGSGKPKFHPVEHEGYLIVPEPISENGQWRLHAVIMREINGEMKQHRMVRADILPTAEQAAEFAVKKARQMIKEQGERLFLK